MDLVIHREQSSKCAPAGPGKALDEVEFWLWGHKNWFIRCALTSNSIIVKCVSPGEIMTLGNYRPLYTYAKEAVKKLGEQVNLKTSKEEE